MWKDVLTHKEIIGIGIRSTNTKEFHQVMKLAMYISAYGDGAFLQP